MMDSEPEYHKRDYSFNFYPACSTSKNTKPGNCDLTHSAQQNTKLFTWARFALKAYAEITIV